MINIHDAHTGQTIVVILNGHVQRLNAFTILLDGRVVEFLDAIYVEDLERLDHAPDRAEPTDESEI